MNQILSIVSLAGAVGLAVLGLKLPNHPYQTSLAVMLVALGYHRGWLAAPRKPWEWLLPILNTLVLAMILKLAIGGGVHSPLDWLRYPKFGGQGEQAPGWLQLPQLGWTWEKPFLANWQIDLTVLQTCLFLLTSVGALVRFQPFASLTAILLLVISIPALAGFEWTYVFPALLLALTGFYLQSPLGQRSVVRGTFPGDAVT